MIYHHVYIIAAALAVVSESHCLIPSQLCTISISIYSTHHMTSHECHMTVAKRLKKKAEITKSGTIDALFNYNICCSYATPRIPYV